MAPFKTQSEKRLALILVVVLGAIVVLVGGKQFYSYRNYLQEHLVEIENAELEVAGWLSERDLWKQRAEWLETHQVPLAEPESREESLKFLQLVEDLARKADVELASKSMQEIQASSQWTGLPLKVEGSGKFSAIAKWLHQLQRPENFVVIREMTLKAGSNQDFVTCSMDLMRCYPPSPQNP